MPRGGGGAYGRLAETEVLMADFDILYVDDDREILQMVGEYLARAGYSVDVVDNGIEAFDMVQAGDYDIVFTDFKMPEFSGLDLLKAIKGYRPEIDVVIVTGHGTMESAIEAMKVGSYDYLQKPFKLDQLRSLIENLRAQKARPAETDADPSHGERHQYHSLIGLSPAMRGIYDRIDRMRSEFSNVVIEGESGTGKELTARVIHQTGPCQETAFVSLNCQGMRQKAGGRDLKELLAAALGQAAEATLFLNEVGDLPLADQEKLLDVMADGIGPEPASSRINRCIATSSRSLGDAVSRGEFNKALLKRLSGVTLNTPPLRERREDICLLIPHFLKRFNPPDRRPIGGISFEALDVLLRYHWPGNVIQLENVIERAVALGVEILIHVEDLPSEIRTFNEISKIG